MLALAIVAVLVTFADVAIIVWFWAANRKHKKPISRCADCHFPRDVRNGL